MTYKERMAALKCVVIIPTYNNAGTILQVITDTKQFASDILVVNDGSTDSTSEILSGIDNIRVIGYQENKGKGYALKLGLKKAHEWGYRYAITIDADGQHFADDIPVFIDRIEQVPGSLLVGARNLTADNMPSKNTFANKFSNFWYKVETGKKLTDTQSGFRLYPLDKLQKMRFLTGRYEFEVEIIVRAAWRFVNVENVPVKVYYPPAEERVSHFRPFKDFTRISILNTLLVIYSLLFYYPWRFVRMFSPANVRHFIDKQIIHSGESNMRLACAIGWGVFCSIIPIWGYQAIFAGISAHFLKLNKVVAIVFTNISVPPLIPFILYASMHIGTRLLGTGVAGRFGNITMETISNSLLQYVVGSIVLAVLVGLSAFVLSFLIMTVFKRRNRYE